MQIKLLITPESGPSSVSCCIYIGDDCLSALSSVGEKWVNVLLSVFQLYIIPETQMHARSLAPWWLYLLVAVSALEMVWEIWTEFTFACSEEVHIDYSFGHSLCIAHVSSSCSSLSDC